MKLIYSVLLAFAFILLASTSVMAEVTQVNKAFYGIIEDDGSLTTTTDPVNDFKAIGFVCVNNQCSQVSGTLWDGTTLFSAAESQITLTYPTTLQQSGYGVYIYKQGYVPYEIKANWSGTGSVSARDDYLTRVRNCKVPINHLIISHNGNNITVNVTLDASVSSPIKNAGPLTYTPSSLLDHYSVNSKVDFRFIGPQNVNVTRTVNLPYSETREVSASVNNLAAGNYRIEIESNTVDEKCLNSIPNKLNSNILISGNATNVTLPLIGILSPENKTYTNRTILVNLQSVNATSVFYNWNGVNITYTSPVLVTFNNGVNTLTAYARNNATTAKASVTFTVNSGGGNGSNQTDTTPPKSVSNLHLDDRGKTYLYWVWTNPTDSDFSRAIVYLDGINVVNTSSSSFNATGLGVGSTHTITIHTIDISGNINNTDVSNTATTLSDGGNGGNGGSSSNGKRNVASLLSPYVANETIPLFEEEDTSGIDLTPAKKKINWLLVAMTILMLASLALLILILMLASKKGAI